MLDRLSLLPGLFTICLVAAAAPTRPESSGYPREIPRCPDIFQETPLQESAISDPALANRLALLGNLTRPERLRELAVPLLIPRPVGSAGHASVRDHLVKYLGALGWDVDLDAFAAETPIGPLEFANVVATQPAPPQLADAAAEPRPVLVLAAHYDSATLPGGGFVGATDSAVPCAILLMLAEALKALGASADVGGTPRIRLVFFDGEEAIGGGWTNDNSLYGSRHLAARWLLAESGVNPGCPAVAEVTDLVLLDLIGASRPRFYFTTQPGGPRRLVTKERSDFARLAAAEKRLRAAGLLPESADSLEPFFFFPPRAGARQPVDTVDDDHAPFRQFGVPALHLVPRPFPPGWHTPGDNAESVNWRHSAAVARVLLTWLLESVQGNKLPTPAV